MGDYLGPCVCSCVICMGAFVLQGRRYALPLLGCSLRGTPASECRRALSLWTDEITKVASRKICLPGREHGMRELYSLIPTNHW